MAEAGDPIRISTKEIPPEDRLIFALDVPTVEEARRLVTTLGDAVQFYKVGLELFASGGYFELIDWLAEQGKKVFADLKLFDVPETVASAVRQLRQHPITFTTVHGNDGILQAACDDSMGKGMVEVRPDDGIAADAAAGSDYIKVREDRMFSQRDLRLLETHEAWVHIGTTQNGLAQPVCTFLGKAAPRTTVTQEGLAVLTEMLNLRSHPRRLAKLMHRIEGIRAASEGASFVEVFELFRTDGMTEDEAWAASVRIFRGSLPDAGPFTKDLGYGKGLILTFLYVRLAIYLGRAHRIPLLFCGKVDLLDMVTLHQLEEEGLVEQPRFIPPPFFGTRML